LPPSRSRVYPGSRRVIDAPLIHPEHLARVEGFVERAVRDGARILLGGRRAVEVGDLWYEPTLVAPRQNEQQIVQREVFGPVLTFTQTPDKRTVTLAIFYFSPQTGGGFKIPWGQMMAATVLVTLPLIVLTLIF
jgi:hypothetical protein